MRAACSVSGARSGAVIRGFWQAHAAELPLHQITAEVGAAVSAHPDIDMVSFTGSTRAGREVAAVAADTVKRVALSSAARPPP